MESEEVVSGGPFSTDDACGSREPPAAMSNTRERTITLDVEMEDYHRIVNGVDHRKRKNTAIDT